MRAALLLSLVVLLAGAGLGSAQLPPPPGQPEVLPAPNGPAVPPELLPPGTTTLDQGAMPPPLAGPPGEGPPDGAVVDAGPPDRRPAGTSCWITGSYLHWWIRHDGPPPLFTTGSPSDAVPGALGQPGTVPAVTSPDNSESRPGMRFDLGYRFERLGGLSLEADFLYLPNRPTYFVPVYSASGQVVARPFYDASAGAESAEQVLIPGQQTGTVNAEADTNLIGGEVNLRLPVCRGPVWQVGLLAGYRVLNLHDTLDVNEINAVLASTPGRADILTRQDHFDSTNLFNGGQLGCDLTWTRDRLSVQTYGKAAFGLTDETVNIRGSTLAQSFDGSFSQRTPGGLLALPSNIGTYTRTQFGFVPEVGCRVGYRVGEHWRFDVGYTLLVWDEVARAANQVDRAINPSQVTFTGQPAALVGPARPAFFGREADFVAQGVTFTVEFRY